MLGWCGLGNPAYFRSFSIIRARDWAGCGGERGPIWLVLSVISAVLIDLWEVLGRDRDVGIGAAGGPGGWMDQVDRIVK